MDIKGYERGDQPILRSLMFVPGIREKFIEKAPSIPADLICLDLEDSVPAAEKGAARKLVGNSIPNMERLGYKLYVRVNGYNTGLMEDDLDAVISKNIDGLSIPKADSADTMKKIDAYLSFLEKTRGIPEGQIKLIPWIELAIGLSNVEEIIRSTPRIIGASFGGEDFATDMGVQRTRDSKELEYGRFAVATACIAYNVLPIDTPEPDYTDLDHLEKDAGFARSIGYKGKYCIHPAQVEVVNRLFMPTPEEIEHAKKVVDAYNDAEKQGLGAVALDGVMVDRPIVVRAWRLLEWLKGIEGRED